MLALTMTLSFHHHFGLPKTAFRSISGAAGLPSIAKPFRRIVLRCISIKLGLSLDTDNDFSKLLIKECGFSPTELGALSRRFETIKKCKSIDTSIKAVEALREAGFTRDEVKAIIRRNPTVLRMRAETQLMPKMEMMASLGFTPQEIRSIVVASPRFLCYSLDMTLRPHMEALEDALGGKKVLRRALLRNHQILYVQRTLPSSLDILRRCGVSGDRLHYLLSHGPFFLSMSLAKLSDKIQQVKGLGFSESSGMFVHALLSIGKMSPRNYEKRVAGLSSLGFHPHQVVEIVSKCPFLISASVERMQQNFDFIVNSLGCEPEVIVRCPALLSYGLENVLKPRYRVIEYLKEVQKLKRVPGILTVSSQSEKTFLERYVLGKPYSSDLLRVYKGVFLKTQSRVCSQ